MCSSQRCELSVSIWVNCSLQSLQWEAEVSVEEQDMETSSSDRPVDWQYVAGISSGQFMECVRHSTVAVSSRSHCSHTFWSPTPSAVPCRQGVWSICVNQLLGVIAQTCRDVNKASDSKATAKKYKVKDLIFKAKDLIFKAKDLIFKAKDLIFKAKDLIFKTKDLIFKAKDLIFKAKYLIFKAKDLIFKAKSKATTFKAKATNYHKRQHVLFKQSTVLHYGNADAMMNVSRCILKTI